MTIRPIPQPICWIAIAVGLIVSSVESCSHKEGLLDAKQRYFKQKAFDAKCSGVALEKGLKLTLDCGREIPGTILYTSQEDIVRAWVLDRNIKLNCEVSRGGWANCKGLKK